MAERKKRRRFGWSKSLRRLRAGAQNAAEMMKLGRLTTPHRTSFEVVHQERVSALRRYRSIDSEEIERIDSALLLVPPLMVTSEIYDMAPDLSAVSFLLGQGVDVWMIDFGAPERIEGGMSRTLDDHVRAVSDAIDFVRERTGHDVHLGGYSQGGMFCYQAAAYRRSEGLASVITFGSPVDIHRNLPLPMSEQLAESVIGGLRRVIETPLTQLPGLPGFLTSIGFKLVSPKKEVEQVFDFVAKLHDRQALEKRESRRRFLGGEGFVAWPGPALRTFVDEFIVANRMASGGFVIDGRTVSLADVSCPILYFVGLTDDIARPASVRAIERAAFNADVHEVGVHAGHLGIVVGGRALGVTWPAVVAWLRWREGKSDLPAILRHAEAEPIEDVDDAAFDELDLDVEDFYGFATDALEDVWTRIGRVGKEAGEAIEAMRWQLPRLSRLRKIRGETRISAGLALAEQAEAIPEQTFFLWRGRAFTYRDADRRVDNVVRGLLHCGVRAGDRVGVLMRGRPSYLTCVTALNRMGAVAVLLPPNEPAADARASRVTLERALALGEVKLLVADVEHVAEARETFGGDVLVLGGPYGDRRTLPENVIDMEAIDPDAVQVPAGHEPNPGRARDLAMVIFTAGRGEEPRAARITNRRWAFSALGAAAGCTLNPSDTVYCPLPLHHAAGMLVAVGGALIGGSRLALATRFAPEHFWSEARRYGATVVFYAGEMCRALVDAPPDTTDDRNPVRLFAGSGMRADVWARLVNRFHVGVLEFYASTEGNAVLANASGKKVGALGRPLPGATEMSLVAYDFAKDAYLRDEQDRLRRCGVDEPGVLLARVDAGSPMAGFDGYVDESANKERLLRDVFEPGDSWFVTGDVLRQDEGGDYWFVDRLADVVRTAGGAVFTRRVEDTIYRRSDVRMAAAYGLEVEGESALVLAVVPRDRAIDLVALASLVHEKLEPVERPRYVRIVSDVPLTAGYRPLKRALVEQGLAGECLRLDEGGRYVPMIGDEIRATL